MELAAVGCRPVRMSMVIALIAGCAVLGVGPSVSWPAAFAGDLAGAWQGSFWWLGGVLYADEGSLLVQIKDDGGFTATMTPTGAANNIAKASTWSGTVSQNERLVVFHVAKGSLPAWSSLARSGDMLYGVAKNPATGANIEIKLERASRGLQLGLGPRVLQRPPEPVTRDVEPQDAPVRHLGFLLLRTR